MNEQCEQFFPRFAFHGCLETLKAKLELGWCLTHHAFLTHDTLHVEVSPPAHSNPCTFGEGQP